MRHPLSKLVLGLCGCVLMLSMTACNLSELDFPFAPITIDEAIEQERATNTPALTAPAILEDGVLTVGLLSSELTAPNVIVGSNNSLVGLDIELASIVANNLGLTVRFVEVSDISAAARGECDVVMNAKAGEETDVTIVGRYLENAVAFFHRGAQQILSVEELEGATVGLQDGSTSQFLLQQSNIVMNQALYSNLNEAFDALDRGEVDYVLCDAYSGAYLAGTKDNINFCGTINAATSLGLAVDATNTELQSALSSALMSAQTGGAYDLVRSRWLGGMQAIDDTSIVQGVELSDALISNASADTVESHADDPQDGSTAGSNAAGFVGN